MRERRMRELGQFVAEEARRAAREAVQQALATLWAYGVAASSPVADPDGSGRQVVDVTVGSVTWPAVPVRTGETITQGDQVLVWMGGIPHVAGWLVIRI